VPTTSHVFSRAQGHEVKSCLPKYVRPFVKSNKNDYIDAEAIAEAVQRPTMRFVPIKTEAQLDSRPCTVCVIAGWGDGPP